MATYRSSYDNYYSDKTGNHSPVGSVLPVFADLNMASQDPEYSYPQHLYCDGKELKIRDYPELYSILKNRLYRNLQFGMVWVCVAPLEKLLL